MTYVVNNIEFYSLAFSGVLDSKVKPLGVSLGIDIVLHQEIVFTV